MYEDLIHLIAFGIGLYIWRLLRLFCNQRTLLFLCFGLAVQGSATAQSVVWSGSTSSGCGDTLVVPVLPGDLVVWCAGVADGNAPSTWATSQFDDGSAPGWATVISGGEWGPGGSSKDGKVDLRSVVVPPGVSSLTTSLSGQSGAMMSVVVLDGVTDAVVGVETDNNWSPVTPGGESVVLGFVVQQSGTAPAALAGWSQLAAACDGTSSAFVRDETSSVAVTPAVGVPSGFASLLSVAVEIDAEAAPASPPPWTNPNIPTWHTVVGGECVVSVCVYNPVRSPGVNYYSWRMNTTLSGPSPGVVCSPINIAEPLQSWLQLNYPNGAGTTSGRVDSLWHVVANLSADDQSMCVHCGVDCDNCEPWGDLDGDGVRNSNDADKDGDGIADSCDVFDGCTNHGSCADADGDGIINSCDPDGDQDGDGVTDSCDSTPIGPACSPAPPDPCLDDGDFDGDGVTNDCDTDPDIDGDGTPNSTDPSPYGCGPSTACPCGACEAQGDADGDGILNDVDDDDDDDGELDVNDACPRGCSCCSPTQHQFDWGCADCTEQLDLLTGSLGLLQVVDGFCEPLDDGGVPASWNSISWDSPYFTDVADCDWDGDGCVNSQDAHPCDPQLKCGDCDFSIEDKVEKLRLGLENEFSLSTSIWAPGSPTICNMCFDVALPAVDIVTLCVVPPAGSPFYAVGQTILSFFRTFIVLAMCWYLVKCIVHDIGTF